MRAERATTAGAPAARTSRRWSAAGIVAGVVVVAASAGATTGATGAATAATAAPRSAQPETDAEIEIELVRRGGLAPLGGRLLVMDRRGVRLDTERLGERLVPWDRIRRVEGVDDPRVDGWLADGTAVWRARTRIDRGDPLLAEPLLAGLFDRMRGREDELARTAIEGLLRCRIARGGHAEAIEPLLETLRLEAAGVTTRAYAALPPVLDPAHALAPAIPPAWHRGVDAGALAARLDEAVRRLERSAASEVLSDRARAAATRAAAVAAAYRHAARAAAGLPPGPLPEAGDDAGLRLLVRCLLGADAAAARTAAGARADADAPDPPVDPASLLEPADPVDDRPAWVRDWQAFFDGERRLASGDVLEQDRGLVALLRVPALHAVERPYLAGLALARAADFLDRAGREEEAAVLRADLAARFRGHPAIPASPAGPAGDPESPVP